MAGHSKLSGAIQRLSLQLRYPRTLPLPHKPEWLSIPLQSSIAVPLRLDPTMQATLSSGGRAESRGFYITDKPYTTELAAGSTQEIFGFLSSLQVELEIQFMCEGSLCYTLFLSTPCSGV